MRLAGSTIRSSTASRELFKHHMLEHGLIHEETIKEGGNTVSVLGYARGHKHEA